MKNTMEENAYEKLKRKISETINDKELERLKEHFAPLVCSRRSLSRVHSALDLFRLLEIRDCLSESNVSCLLNLTVINNTEVEDLVRTYKKLYGSEPKPCLCQLPVQKLQLTTTVHEPTNFSYINDAQMFSQVQYENGNSLDDNTIRLLCQNIGEAWPVLLRELGLLEKCISEIRENSPDVKEQAMMALQMWKNEAGENATYATLKKALSSRLCKRKGLGPHLIIQNQISCC